MKTANRDDLPSDDFLEHVGKLIEALDATIQAHLPLTDSEIITACGYTLANALASIECAGCCKVTRESIERHLPKMLAEAMEVNHAGVSDCVH